MEMFSLSWEAEKLYEAWLNQLTDGSLGFLACNDPDWRKLLVEQTANHFSSHQHIILDLSETRVQNWQEMLESKLGDMEELSPEVMLHIVNLEMSYLESVVSEELQPQHWGQAITDQPAPTIRIYGDEPLLTALSAMTNGLLESDTPVCSIPSIPSPLPYEALEKLSPEMGEGAVKIADLLTMAGAIAHAAHWYDKALELSAPEGLVYVGQGEIALHRGKYPEAESLMNQALESLEEGQHSEKGRAYLALGRIEFGNRNWKKAIKQLKAGQRHISAEDEPEEWGEFSRIQARAWEQIGEPAKAVAAYIAAAEHWAAFPKYALPAAKAYQSAAAMCQNQHQPQQALTHFSAGIPLAKAAGNEFLEVSLEDSVEAMEELVKKAEKRGKKGLFGKLFS